MGLPSTGSISMSQVNTELKKSATAIISLNDSDVRKLAGKTSGTISMNDLRGKKASESVANYPIYNNSWEGHALQGTVSIPFPHKIISGNLIVTSGFRLVNNSYKVTRTGYVKLLETTVQKGTKTIPISNTSKVSLSYDSGYGTDPSYTGYCNGIVTVDIKFTGEWEA